MIGTLVGAVLLCLAATATPQPLDRVVAVVEREAVTASQMLREMRLGVLLRAGLCAARHVQLPRPGAGVDPAAEVLAHQLQDHVIDQRLVLGQVRRQGAAAVGEAELAQRQSALYGRFDSRAAALAALAELGASEADLVAMLRRDLANERFLHSRLAPRAAVGARLEVPDPQGVEHGTREAGEAARDPQPDAALPTVALDSEVLRAWLAQLRQHGETRVLGANGRLELLRSGEAEARGPW